MSSIFTRIIGGEIPGRLIWDDEICVVMIDIRPLKRGHCLVIPKQEIDHWVDLDPTVAAHLMTVAATIAKVQSAAMAGERIGLLIAGFEVPHAHIHVTPIDSMADLDFAEADSNVSDRDLDAVAEVLRSGLLAAGHQKNVV